MGRMERPVAASAPNRRARLTRADDVSLSRHGPTRYRCERRSCDREQMGALARAVAIAIMTGLACVSCRERPAAAIREEEAVRAAPAPDDRDGPCADVADVRACWTSAAGGGDGCERGVCLVARPLPDGAFARSAARSTPEQRAFARSAARSTPEQRASAPSAAWSTLEPPGAAGDWRCSGQRDQRRCVRRAGSAGRFVCHAETCTQHHPRAPDDGAWECADIAGVVFCRGGEPAAGVVAGPVDPAFFCGPLRGAADDKMRVCVDLTADRPPGAIDGWACRFEYAHGEALRVCTRSDAPVVGGRCDVATEDAARASCPRGAECVRGRCLPARPPAPECWLDSDCGAGRACQFAACISR
jgi:hypothetical protein